VPPKAEAAAAAATAAPPAEAAAAVTEVEVEAEVEMAMPAALEPKVMAPFDTPAGDVPRRVQIERKKRLYASQDIGELLQAEGVNTFLHQPSGLELSYFDDREYDSRTFDEWTLPEALEQGVRCKVAVYPERGVPTWEAGLLVGGDAQAHHFTVQLSGGGGVVTVPRVDVCFDAEDPFQFVRRRVSSDQTGPLEHNSSHRSHVNSGSPQIPVSCLSSR